MTLWYKSWLEIRSRLIIGLLAWIFMLLMFMLLAHAGSVRKEPVRDSVENTAGLETIMLMVFGALLAGTGIIAQSCGKVAVRAPESALFTLSLPVSRRRVFLSRAAAGGAGVVLQVVLFWLLLPAFVWQRGTPVLTLAALPFQMMAAALAYSLALLSISLFNETVFSFLVGLVGAFAGLAMGFGWSVAVRFLRLVSGAGFLQTGHIPWTGIAGCLLLSCAAVYCAVRTIERREF